jgi:hypothetical protein
MLFGLASLYGAMGTTAMVELLRVLPGLMGSPLAFIGMINVAVFLYYYPLLEGGKSHGPKKEVGRHGKRSSGSLMPGMRTRVQGVHGSDYRKG